MSVPSASSAKAVMPTTVPLAALSLTSSTEASESMMAPTSNSSKSVTLIVIDCVLKDVSVLLARTVTEWLVAVS